MSYLRGGVRLLPIGLPLWLIATAFILCRTSDPTARLRRQRYDS